MLLKTRLDATVKAYLRFIKKLFDLCRTKRIFIQSLCSVGVVLLYLFELYRSRSPSSSIAQTHPTLKWLHSFMPTVGYKRVMIFAKYY